MVGIEINGSIKTYPILPKVWGNIIGLNYMSSDGQKEIGFYPVVVPTHDTRFEELGEIYFSEDSYTYDVNDKSIKESLKDLKTEKISELKSTTSLKLSVTDWYIIREADSGKLTPQNIKDERSAIRTKSDSIESQINNLTVKKDVLLFKIKF